VSRNNLTIAVSRRSSKLRPFMDRSNLLRSAASKTATGSSGIAGGRSPAIGERWIRSSSIAHR
jgi:hypothetical protein